MTRLAAPMTAGETRANLPAISVGAEPFPGYRLRRGLGRGSFGEVWEAEREDGTPVALKFLPCKGSLNASKEIRSVRAVQQLTHPNLASVLQMWCYPGYLVIGMELADTDLLQVLRGYQRELGTPMPPEHACLVLMDAASGLDFMNARQHFINGRIVGVQHCDIKPTNLLLFGEKLKLCDYGLATLTGSPMEPYQRGGTPDYSAPELFRGVVSDWTDQYALAVTYCELRGGKLPFSDTPKSFRRDYVRPMPDLTMLPPAEQPIISRALCPTPSCRWPSCTALVSALAKLVLR